MQSETKNKKYVFKVNLFSQKIIMCFLIAFTITPTTIKADELDALYLDLFKAIVEIATDEPTPNASSTSGNYDRTQARGGGSCEQQAEALDAEFVQRNNSIPSNDNVARLALIHSVSLRMRDIWLPCNKEKASNYEKTAADTLNTCLGIATHEAVCR